MNISKAVKHLFPNAELERDFMVQDDSDGNGPYIKQWNLPDPQPSQSDLETAWAQVKNVSPEPGLEEQLKNLQKAFNEFILGG